LLGEDESAIVKGERAPPAVPSFWIIARNDGSTLIFMPDPGPVTVRAWPLVRRWAVLVPAPLVPPATPPLLTMSGALMPAIACEELLTASVGAAVPGLAVFSQLASA
jgi:hypothetical protein